MPTSARLPAALRPEPCGPLIRLGPSNDGGYVLPTLLLPHIRHILSFGVADDWGFEQDLVARTGASLDAFDHSIGRRFWAKRRLVHTAELIKGGKLRGGRVTYGSFRRFFDGGTRRHHPTQVGYATDYSESVSSAIEKFGANSGNFIKCDIEGWEWRAVSGADIPGSVVGLVAEFHDVDLHLDRLKALAGQMLDEFAIVHLNVNNYSWVSPNCTPFTIEVSFARRSALSTARHMMNMDWRLLCAPNNAAAPVIDIEFY